MEKEEKTIIEQTVENPTVVNEDVIKNDDETSQEDEVIASTEDETLAPTDDVIPAPVDVPGTEPIAEPVLDAPLADIAPPMQDIPVDVPAEEPVIPEDPAAIAPVEEPCAECPCEEPCAEEPCCDGSCSSVVTVANYFGTLQECVTIAWRFHLKTRKHHIHIALNEFYEKALDIVDDIIEQYQGICGVVEEPFVNCVIGEGKTEGEYITELKAFVENNRCVASCGHSEIDSTIDEFLGLIDSTNYKLVNLTENAVKSFEEFVYEDYPTIKESCCGDNGDSDFDNAEEE